MSMIICPPPEPRSPQPERAAQAADYLLAMGRAGRLDMEDVLKMHLVQRRLRDLEGGR